MKKENHNFLHETERKFQYYFKNFENIQYMNRLYPFVGKFKLYIFYEFGSKLIKLILKHERTENELRQKLENAEKKIQEYEKMLNL